MNENAIARNVFQQFLAEIRPSLVAMNYRILK